MPDSRLSTSPALSFESVATASGLTSVEAPEYVYFSDHSTDSPEKYSRDNKIFQTALTELGVPKREGLFLKWDGGETAWVINEIQVSSKHRSKEERYDHSRYFIWDRSIITHSMRCEDSACGGYQDLKDVHQIKKEDGGYLRGCIGGAGPWSCNKRLRATAQQIEYRQLLTDHERIFHDITSKMQATSYEKTKIKSAIHVVRPFKERFHTYPEYVVYGEERYVPVQSLEKDITPPDTLPSVLEWLSTAEPSSIPDETSAEAEENAETDTKSSRLRRAWEKMSKCRSEAVKIRDD